MIYVPRSHLSLSRPSPASTQRLRPRTACPHDHLRREAARACLLASSRPLGTESASLPWLSAQRSALSIVGLLIRMHRRPFVQPAICCVIRYLRPTLLYQIRAHV
jgi:hypothetical protein